ncbi:hypothetical protein LX32DRAFT_714227 [Colletotrichum zoysiae]|uniref:Uncharacterized protein n=1 Tax=Colletotrichum zoysiae TaxID=1216348 RepID=A0AAD9H378_9PEZI|nr:hypothetical protein LX32DRAFT_714227 [Colletotrichum zoysiae]
METTRYAGSVLLSPLSFFRGAWAGLGGEAEGQMLIAAKTTAATNTATVAAWDHELLIGVRTTGFEILLLNRNSIRKSAKPAHDIVKVPHAKPAGVDVVLVRPELGERIHPEDLELVEELHGHGLVLAAGPNDQEMVREDPSRPAAVQGPSQSRHLGLDVLIRTVERRWIEMDEWKGEYSNRYPLDDESGQVVIA